MKKRVNKSRNQVLPDVAVPEIVETPSKNKKKRKLKKENENDDVTFIVPESVAEMSELFTDTASSETYETSSQMSSTETSTKKKKKRKKKLIRESVKVEEMNASTTENDVFNGDVQTDTKHAVTSGEDWSKEDKIHLLNQIEAAIPKNDSVKYSLRVTKIDWNNISFGDHSDEDCLTMWKKLQNQMRCFRLLKEIVTDARQFVEQGHQANAFKLAKHPDFPTKPLTSFMLYYMESKNKILADNPGLSATEISKRVGEQWKLLNPKKLEKYKSKALLLKQKYEEKVRQFYEEHPELAVTSANRHDCRRPRLDNLGFSKPRSAFQLYYHAIREKDSTAKPGELQDKCKQKWKSMSEKKKAVWIEAAQKEEESYREALKKYELEHPGYTAPPVKTLITKNDIHVLNNLSGKPKKPASNAYSLFSCEMLQSGALSSIVSKERLSEISRRWKNLSQAERDQYVAKCEKLHETYKKEYEKYLNSLSPEKREEELKSQSKKRKIENKAKTTAKKLKTEEPAKPPENEFELFKIKRASQWLPGSGGSVDNQARLAWKKLSPSEKKEYTRELNKLNSVYIENLTNFLQHCPPEKLTEYVNIIANQKKSVKQDIFSSEDSESDSNSN